MHGKERKIKNGNANNIRRKERFMTEKRPLVFALANRKGGVSKTTNTANIGYAFAQQGYKVLLIDDDPQGSLTQMLGIDRNVGGEQELSVMNFVRVSRSLRGELPEHYPVDDLFGNPSKWETESHEIPGLHNLVNKVFFGDPVTREDVDACILSPTYRVPKQRRGPKPAGMTEEQEYDEYFFGFDLIPSGEALTDDELLIALDQSEERRAGKGTILLQICSLVAKYRDYDIILIDTGPSLGVLTVNAIAAATDGVIISASVDEQSLWSLSKFKLNLRQIKQMIPGHEGVLGVILAPVDPRAQIYPIIRSKITEVLQLYLFPAAIARSATAAKATSSGVLYSQLDENAYQSYQELAKEILERHAQNTKWEHERNSKVSARIEELAAMPENAGKEYPVLEQIVRDEYSGGKLWEMPDSQIYKEEEK